MTVDGLVVVGDSQAGWSVTEMNVFTTDCSFRSLADGVCSVQ